MSFGGHIGQHRPNARVSERENSLSPQDVITQQVSHDPAVLRQGVHLLSGILTLLPAGLRGNTSEPSGTEESS